MYYILSSCPGAFITESRDAPNDTRLRFPIAAAVFNTTIGAHPIKRAYQSESSLFILFSGSKQGKVYSLGDLRWL